MPLAPQLSLALAPSVPAPLRALIAEVFDAQRCKPWEPEEEITERRARLAVLPETYAAWRGLRPVAPAPERPA